MEAGGESNPEETAGEQGICPLLESELEEQLKRSGEQGAVPASFGDGL